MRKGLRVTAGFIIGFDNEKPGAGDRIIQFVEKSGISLAMFSMLQVLPNTALWTRLEKEERIVEGTANINQTTLMNFIPTRPVEDIAKEYIQAFWELYDPLKYLERTYRQFMILGEPRNPSQLRRPNFATLRALFIICWRQGIVRKTRWKFWVYLVSMIKNKNSHWQHYLSICALGEHFLEYRELVRSQIQSQLDEYLKLQAAQAEEKQPAIAEKSA